ncbi:aspartate/glutamate racemase family protein [Janthinobacterium sp.]|uniref:aspartate/glutamate racemase family protein n=1 Tax=Janthinobacterium sp. TaxID=1871054 RepID=UPI00293D7BBF|nr:amino acid racemase [Janthinobacterium sp.]
MKTIGLIGGIGWASTAEYYRLINELVAHRLGLSHSAKIVLLSLDQSDFTDRAAQEDPAAIEAFLVAEGLRLKAAGADFFLYCANGVHRFAERVVPRIGLPFVSIVEETALRVRSSQLKTVGLLGVKPTMTGRFYQDRLARDGVATLTPSPRDQELIHDIIYGELVHNRMTAQSRAHFVRIINDLQGAGAGGVILGCTEIPLLIGRDDVDIPVFNTTSIHCEAAVEFALR